MNFTTYKSNKFEFANRKSLRAYLKSRIDGDDFKIKK